MSKDLLPFTRPSIDEATIQGVVEVLRSGWLASGPHVERFEQELSKLCGGRPVRALTSATESAIIAAVAVGVQPLSLLGLISVCTAVSPEAPSVSIGPHSTVHLIQEL